MPPSLRHRALLLATRVALGCAFSTLPAHSQTLSAEARRHFAVARQAQDAGSFDKAAQEYSTTIHLAPSFAGAYSNLGLVLYVQGRFKESSIALDKALHLDPKLIGATLYLGIDLLKLNHADQALPYLQRAAQLDPNNKDAQSWLGTAYWDCGQTWTALEQLRQTDRNFPGDPDLLFVLGESYRKTADGEFQSVIQSASGTAFVHEVFGDIYLNQHALVKAGGHYRRALEQDPKAAGLHFKLGEVALESGHLDEAQREYLLELQGHPDDVPCRARLAELKLLAGQISTSLQGLNEALALSPLQTVSALRLPPSFATTDEDFTESTLQALRAALPELEKIAPGPARNLAVATAYARLGMYDHFAGPWLEFQSSVTRTPLPASMRDRAKADFERQSFDDAAEEIHAWLKTHPENLDARYLAARCHRYLSLAVLDKLLTTFPDSYRSHQLLAQTYEQRDEDDKATEEYKKVEELAPALPGIHFELGRLFIKEGDLERAITQLKEELRLDPDHPGANAEMGMALVSQDEDVEALPYLTKAISLEPNLWLAHQQLGKIYYLQKNFGAARRELTLATTDDPLGASHYQLALVYQALGQTQDASREFAASRKIKSDRLAQIQMEMQAGANHD